MQNLTRASRELFRRTPDETYASLEALVDHCHQQRETSTDHWLSPNSLWAKPVNTDCLMLANGDDQSFHLNDWSFGQLCRLAGVTKETVNRLTSDTAARVFAETLPRGNKPLQVFSTGERHDPSTVLPIPGSTMPSCWTSCWSAPTASRHRRKDSTVERDCTVESRICSAF